MNYECPLCKSALTKGQYQTALHLHAQEQTTLKKERAALAGKAAAFERDRKKLADTHKRALLQLRSDYLEKQRAALKERDALARKAAAFDREKKALGNAHKLTLQQVKREHLAEKAVVKKQALAQARKEFEARAEAGTAQTIGLAHEAALLEILQKEFRNTARVWREGKKGDVHCVPLLSGKDIADSLIVFENKRSASITAEDLRDAAKAKRKSGAATVVLVTSGTTLDRRTFHGITHRDDIIIVAPEGALTVARMHHSFSVTVAQANLAQDERSERSRNLLDYIESPQFRSPIEELVRDARDDAKDINNEMASHRTWWERRVARNQRTLCNADVTRATAAAIARGEKPPTRLEFTGNRSEALIKHDVPKAPALAIPSRRVPVLASCDDTEIAKLTDSQRAMLCAILNGKTTFHGVERWTVEALQRRKILAVERDESQLMSPQTLRLTPRGVELATMLAE